jgi:DNA polymerase-3 subunit delta
VYSLYGDEDFLIDEAIAALTKEILRDASRDFNLDVFHGADVNGEKIVSCAAAFPMLAAHRLVVVREFQHVEGKERVYSYIENPSPTTCLVLASEKSDPKIGRRAVSVEFRPLRADELSQWIVDRAKHYNRGMSPEAADVLLTYADHSLQTLDREIEKVSVYVGERKEISGVDVAAVAGVSKSFNVFELTKAVGERNIKRSMEILERMMELGEPPVLMVATLTKHFMNLLRFAEGQKKKMTNSELSSMLRAGQSRLSEYAVQLRKFSPTELEKSFASLVMADEKLKFSSEDPRLIMTVLIHELVR